jgi:hypothetical protein
MPPPAYVHSTNVSAFLVTSILKPFNPRQQVVFKPQAIVAVLHMAKVTVSNIKCRQPAVPSISNPALRKYVNYL